MESGEIVGHVALHEPSDPKKRSMSGLVWVNSGERCC